MSEVEGLGSSGNLGVIGGLRLGYILPMLIYHMQI